MQQISNNSLQSKVISFLRFPLIVGVILIHTQLSNANEEFICYENTKFIISNVIARIAVPLFFVCSGFLFFFKTEEFSLHTYLSKLKKRVKTLLIPYLIWNTLFIVAFNIISGGFVIGEGFGWKNWLRVFGGNCFHHPSNYPLWFIGDLMWVILFTPIIYWLTKRLRVFFPLILGVLWLINSNICWKTEAFFFFCLGAFFSINKKCFTDLVKSHTLILGLIYLLFVIATFCAKDYAFWIYLRRLSVVIGMGFVVSLVAKFIANGKWKENKFLTTSSFFLYLHHAILLPSYKKVLITIIPPTCDANMIILYFLWAILTIIIGLGLYYIIKRLLPKTTSFLMGGR
jgi:hypothetical protein